MATSGKQRQSSYRAREREAGQCRIDVSSSHETRQQLRQLAARYGATQRFVLGRLIQLAIDDLKRTGVIR